MNKFEIWAYGALAALISGGANGVITGFAAVGIRPDVFNLNSGIHATLEIAGVASLFGAIMGVAVYLKQSPLPNGGNTQ